MKRVALYLGLAAALMASCSIQEEDIKTPQQDDVIYYASFEQPTEDGTRVYANEDLLLRWTADDRVSIFGKNTYNQQYRFIGETGDNSGGFSKVDGAEYITGNPISHTVSVYPYQEGTKISEDEVVTLTLPAVQHYAENTFGLGANTMVSVSEDNFLQYKNVGGYLMLKLYGEGVSVSSITLKGNNGEKLADKATVTVPIDGVPTAVMADNASTEITLTCPTPVPLGATAEESTQFWFVVPPVVFSEGFTITVAGPGGDFEKSTGKVVTIERNKLSKMSALEVELLQPKNVIYYTSLDGNVVIPYNPEAFDAGIVSNEYVEGVGTITFDGDVTSIGDDAFSYSGLMSIIIPNSVTSIGQLAFHFCGGLTSITIPNSVTSIGDGAFYHCRGLTCITIPDSVTSIGGLVFSDCTSLTGITIPDSVTSIGDSAFSGCTSLTSITIPDSVTSIGYSAFSNCTSLANITIPDSVTSISVAAFSYCTSLTSITIPDSVTSIGNYAFSNCTSLTGITIPASVMSIGDGVFGGCLAMMSFSGKFATPDGLFLIDCGNLIAVALGSVNEVIIFPDGVTSIGGGVFSGCTSLTSITIPDGVTSIGGGVFSGCTSLTSITIPDGVTSIGNAAFSGCSGLTSFTIPDSVTSIEGSVFSDCTSLTSITISDGVTSIGDFAFSNCVSLASITIPDRVTSIGNAAFSGCSGLTSITIKPKVPPTGGWSMFSNTNNCPIYVRAGSIDDYKSAHFWSDYADRIQAIPSSAPIPEAVDLGLSVKWASFNLGASKPEEYGNYYAWGETEPKDDYSWSTYKWCEGTRTTLTKYCNDSSCGYNGFTDTKTVLDPEDDAAVANWGGKWRMPTDAEWTELRENCTWTETTQNGVSGLLVTGTKGKSVFLPAAGRRDGTGLLIVGSSGEYWSSSLRSDLPPDCAWYVLSPDNPRYVTDSNRCLGFSVRPVYAE